MPLSRQWKLVLCAGRCQAVKLGNSKDGAAKVYDLAAPPSGNGSDGVFILFPCLGFFLLNRLQGKLFDEGGDVGRPPYRSARPQLYRFGKTAFLAALPPCAFADGEDFQHLGKT